MDIKAELSRLKTLQGINASAFCRLWIEKGLQEEAATRGSHSR
jgi:hypothetical protein